MWPIWLERLERPQKTADFCGSQPFQRQPARSNLHPHPEPGMNAPLLHVSNHAITRAIERCGCRTTAEAQALLTGPAMQIAATIGARCVRLGTGHRVILDGATILTVLPVDNYRRQVQRQGIGRFRSKCMIGEVEE
jgi:hypothetical protein